MNTAQWQQVKELYEHAAEHEPAQWPRLLATTDDAAVRAEVAALLQLLPQAADFIERPPALDASWLQRDAQTLAPGRRIGPYEVLSELGRGGMGVVYLAVRADDAYRKEVAIKLVWPGYDGAEIVRRFQQERQILAQLDHPHITRLLDGGTTEEGWPYVVMEYVDGQPLNQYCDAHRLSISERLKLFQQVCAAVAYAHRHLVVHRDLKPSNILVTDEGAVKLLDFGIAKLLDAATSLTTTGLHAMTPEYASPEQVRGQEITTASDVYSLGVVLYELLTGRQPYRFPNRALHEVLRVIAEAEPLRPSQVCRPGSQRSDVLTTLPAEAGATNTFINSAVENAPDKLRRRLAGDLDKIILKALRKEPEQRYTTVEELSADLTRHLAGEPVVARQPSLGYRAGKFIRRHKTGVAVAVVLLAVVLTGLLGAVWQARVQRRLNYPGQLQQAAEDWAQNNLARMRATLTSQIPQRGQEELRGFEWRYLWRLAHRELLEVRNETTLQGGGLVCGGGRLWTRSTDTSVSVWDSATGRELDRLAVEPDAIIVALDVPDSDCDGRVWFTDTNGTVKEWNMRTGQTRQLFTDPSARISVLETWSLYRAALTGHVDGTLKWWDVATGRSLASLRGAPGRVKDVGLTFDQQRMLTQVVENIALDQSVVQLWDFPARRLIATYTEPLPQGFGISGKWLLRIVDNRILKLHEAATGRLVATFTEPGNKWLCVKMPDPQRLFTCGTDGTVRVYQVPTFRLLAAFTGHRDWVQAANLSPDGKLLVTASSDQTIRFWEFATQRQLAVVKEQMGSIPWAEITGAGRYLISRANNRTFKLWEVATLLAPDSLSGHSGYIYSIAFAPDGQRLATASQDRTVKLWDVQTGQWLKTFAGHNGQVFCVTFSPDGHWLASSGEDHTARIWNAHSGQLQHTLPHPLQIHSVAFAPDGKLLATGCDDRVVRLWDVATGREVRQLNGHTNNVWSVAFSPLPTAHGYLLASGSSDKTVKLWAVATGRELATLAGHTEWVWSAVFSPDGRYLASGSTDRTAKLWEVATGKELRSFSGHADEVFEVAFTPDGQRLATASNDHTVKLWNVATGQELFTLKDHSDQVWSVAFAPDGHMLASGSWDKTVRLWRAAGKGN